MKVTGSEERVKQAPGRLAIVAAEDQHLPAMAEFYRQVWTPDADAASVREARRRAAQANVADPGVPPPTWIAIQDEKVLGFVSTIPALLWDGTTERPAYWIKGLMVLPAFRNGPIGMGLLKAAAKALPCSAGFAVAEPARRLFTALGYIDLGAIPNRIKPLRPGRILSRMDLSENGLLGNNPARPVVKLVRSMGLAGAAGKVIAGGIALAAGVRGPSHRGLRGASEPREDLEKSLDELWGQSRHRLHPAAVRNRRSLVARYGDDRYGWIAARREGRLVGVALVKKPGPGGDPRLNGLRLATLSDMLFSPQESGAGSVLLAAAERWSRDADADAIVASASHPALIGLLSRSGYLGMPGTVHFLFRDVTPNPVGGTLQDWWLTRGDGGADEGI